MRRSWLKRARTQKVILHLANDQSAQGVLVGVYGDGVALKHAELLHSVADPTPMAGEVFWPREQLLFVQLDG